MILFETIKDVAIGRKVLPLLINKLFPKFVRGDGMTFASSRLVVPIIFNIIYELRIASHVKDDAGLNLSVLLNQVSYVFDIELVI